MHVAGVFTDRHQFRLSGHPYFIKIPMADFIEIVRKLEDKICFTINPNGANLSFFLTDEKLQDLLKTYNSDYKCAPEEVNCLWPDVTAVKGSIADAEGVETIVCETDNFLSPAAGAGRAVHAAAGPKLAKACSRLAGCETGRSQITSGFDLPFSKIIHAATPEWHGGRNNEERFLARCYANVLSKAEHLGIEAIAFPPLSAGKGFSAEDAARIAVAAVREYLSLGSSFNRFRLIKWVISDGHTLEAYKREIAKVFRGKEPNGYEDKGEAAC